MSTDKPISTSFRKFRIVEDTYRGYEVQVWRWWWPFWTQAGFVNTHRTIEEATIWARKHMGRTVVERI